MFTGAFTAIVTPFANGKVDEVRLRDQIEFQVREGINGIVAVGTTGEAPTLEFEEQSRVIEQVMKFAKGRVPVIAGVGANSTTEAIKLHKFAKSLGVRAGLSVNPYYNKPTQDGLCRHFLTIADAVDLPIVLYNVPSRCGVSMSPASVARLHNASPRLFTAIKEASGSCDAVSEIRQLCDITVLSGDDSLTLPMMSVGASGVISVLSNVVPGAVAKMVKLFLDENTQEARTLHDRYFNLTKHLFVDGNPGGVKYAMKLLKRDSGEMRLPLVDVNDATKKMIEADLKKLGLL
ncbi:MAG TPA: 4-hydroxy-tetrahydrodipicolinate synthase [Tepidisphaeraceae bacterium]|nr:4-hydroxy-tetrahydrodipicolinate synthase [Tepidisphaeraceae bacterium]